jgi:predicted DNA-binding transcriptional regulator YafY
MASAEQTFRLLRLLQERRHSSVDELAAELGVGRRTVFRYLKALRDGGVEISWNKESGYTIPHGITIPGLNFTDVELITILVGIGFLKSLDDSTLTSSAFKLETKIFGQLDQASRAKLELVRDSFAINPNQKDSFSENLVDWHKLLMTIVERREVSFDYKRGRDGMCERRYVRPYMLIYYFDHWTLTGYDKERKGLRSFVLERMSRVKEEGTVFIKKAKKVEVMNRTGVNAQKYFFAIKTAKLRQLLQMFTAPIVSRETLNDETVLGVMFDNAFYLSQWLLQFGQDVRLISPPSFLEIRKQQLKTLLTQIAVE